jgi:hypothetical protein
MNWRVLPPVKIKRTYFRYTCMYMPYFTLGAFGFLITFFFFVLYLFFHPSYLPSVFIQYFSPFLSLLLSLSFCYIDSTCGRLSLFPHCTFCIFFPLLLSNLFSLLIPTFTSRHHFSFSLPRTPEFLLSYTSRISGFFDCFPSFLLFCAFVPFTQLYIHPSSFCS